MAATMAPASRRGVRQPGGGGAIGRALVWVLVAAALLACALAASRPVQVQATVPGQDQVELAWDSNNRVWYGQYNTPIFTTSDGAGRVSFAYCVDPTTMVPDAGAYATIPVEEFNPEWAAQTRAAMWFGYGGPGFDPSMWPEQWEDGTPMDEEGYYAATHLILSYTTLRMPNYVYYRAGSAFVDYASSTFLGIDASGATVNPDATLFQIIARANEVPDDYTCYYLNCGEWDWYQYVIAQDYYAPEGTLELVKRSSSPEVTDGNPLYSLAGAEYGVYSGPECTAEQWVATLVTDEGGHASNAWIAPGTYYVREGTASPGYALDGTVYTVEVRRGETSTLEVIEEPVSNPPQVLVQKVDADTKGPAQGTATLAGARFEVSYYAGSYEDAGELPDTPTRSWVFETDEQGLALLDDGYLVEGDELFRDAAGRPTMPLGTVAVREVRAPAGYRLTDGSAHLVAVGAGGSGTVGGYVAPVVADEVERGSLSIQKTDVETGAAAPQGSASMAGAEFAVTSLNDGPVVVDGTTYGRGDRVATLVTDEDGYAATGPDALPCGLYRIEETKAPAGYLVADGHWDVEVSPGSVAPAGTDGGAADAPEQPEKRATSPVAALASLFAPSTALAEEPGEEPRPVVAEQVIRGGVRVYKVDADTGEGEAQGDASLEGTEFSIISLNDGPVLVDGSSYGYGEVVKKIYTDEAGVAQTGARDLPFGTYSIDETGAPPGYLREAQFVVIEQDGVVVEVGEPFEDDVMRGGVKIRKVDAESADGSPQGGATLAGARFAIANASEQAVVVRETSFAPGEVVMTVETGEDGVAQTGSHDLPFGTYTVTEIAAPEGYLPDPEAQTVEISENGTVYELERPFADQVVRGGLSVAKVDAETGLPEGQGAAGLAGAQFAIENANGHPVVVGGTSYQPGEVVMTLTTDEAGCASTGERDLPFGTYTVTEVAAPEGYLVCSDARSVTVGEEGVVVAVDPFAEQVARGGFGLRKFDAETGLASPQGAASLAGARFEVVNANEHPVFVGGSTYESGAVVMVIETDESGWAQTADGALPFGTYTVTEVAAPEGYHAGTFDEGTGTVGQPCSITAVVDGDASWHSYESEVYDQVVRGGISVRKVDAETGPQGGAQGSASLAGARFTVTNANEHAVTVGGESFEPGEVVMTLTTDEEGCASTGARDLPFGTYTVAEESAPEGYLADAEPQSVAVHEEGAVVAVANPFADHVARGGVFVQKADAEIGFDGPQGSASYQGAVFEVVNANPNPVVVGGTSYQPGEVVATLTTDEEGYAATGGRDLPFGTYRVAETQAPRGYLLNETVWEVAVERDGETVGVGEAPGNPGTDEAMPRGSDQDPPTLFDTMASAFAPAVALADEGQGIAVQATVPEQVVRGGVSVQKVDGETGLPSPQGGATLAGTEFSIVSLNKRPVVVGGTSYGEGETVMTIVSGEDGVAASGPDDLPFGTYLVRETAAPEGYREANGFEQTFTVSEDGEVVALDRPFSDEPVRGGLSVRKVDADTGASEPLADGTLLGTRFAVVNANEHPVVVGSESFGPGEVVLTLTTDETGYAATGERDLPFGTYTVAEALPPEGYTPGDGSIWTVRIEEDGVVVLCDAAFANRIARGDLAGTKVEDASGSAMPGVSFLVTSLTTGERHVLVADGDGRFATSASQAPHTQGTNANDAALDAEGNVVDESVLSSANGIWFSGSADEETEPDDALGALPFDVYRLDELATSASYGHEPVSFEVAVREDGTVVELGEVDNRLISLRTQASLAQTGTREGPAAPDAEIVDVVAYSGLTPGVPYELRTELVDRDTGLPVTEDAGQAVPFTPDRADGEIEVSVGLDASQLAGTRVAVVERLLLDGVEIASHADIADDAQTVSFVEIGTTALGAASCTHEEQAAQTTSIVDTVAYRGLTSGEEYVVEGALMDRSTGEPLVDAQGTEVVAQTTFTPDTPDGTVEVAFAFDGTGLAGTTAVAFERLLRDGTEVAVHVDLEDDAQAVSLVAIETAAYDKASGSHRAQVSPETVVVDTVAYRGLTPGEEYVLEGVVVAQGDGVALTDATGAAVTSSVSFVPEAPDGSVEVEFAFDSTNLQGTSAVVCENLLHDGTVVASHADLDDAAQTVSWPEPRIPTTGDDARLRGAALAGAGVAVVAAGAAAIVVVNRNERRIR